MRKYWWWMIDEWEKNTHTRNTKRKKKKKKTSDASHGQLAFRLEYLIAPCFFFFFSLSCWTISVPSRLCAQRIYKESCFENSDSKCDRVWCDWNTQRKYDDTSALSVRLPRCCVCECAKFCTRICHGQGVHHSGPQQFHKANVAIV